MFVSLWTSNLFCQYLYIFPLTNSQGDFVLVNYGDWQFINMHNSCPIHSIHKSCIKVAAIWGVFKPSLFSPFEWNSEALPTLPLFIWSGLCTLWLGPNIQTVWAGIVEKKYKVSAKQSVEISTLQEHRTFFLYLRSRSRLGHIGPISGVNVLMWF